MSKKRLTVSEVLNMLQQAGSDHDADTVERLAIQAGFWWKCNCGWVNYFSRSKRCGATIAARRCPGLR